MAEYYATEYREHYSDIAYGAPGGGFAVPGDAHFETAKDSLAPSRKPATLARWARPSR